MTDLFTCDGPLTEADMKAKKRRELARGYAAPPGTGPKGETCGSCKHLSNKRMAKSYKKCWLNHARWTCGRRTDVLVRSPACQKWERE